MSTQELDDMVFSLLNDIYNGRLSYINFRGAHDEPEDNIRHYSFGCIDNEGVNIGIHAYYSYQTKQLVDIYESVGESIE